MVYALTHSTTVHQSRECLRVCLDRSNAWTDVSVSVQCVLLRSCATCLGDHPCDLGHARDLDHAALSRVCPCSCISQMFRVSLQTEVQLSTFSCRVDERTPFYGHDARWRERLRRPQLARSCRPAQARSQKPQISGIHQRPHAHDRTSTV